jgi:ureidoacrylate peracid hydrolase
MKLDPKKTAVVMIEFQNDFTSEGGSLHEAVKGVMESSNMLENARQTVDQARELGATIIHAPIMFDEGYPELGDSPYGILKGVVDTSSFRKGTWGAEFVEGMQPSKGDLVIEGKRGLCAFASTNLDFILRGRGIENVALGGFLTNCCVESSMRTAYERGFNVYTLVDCVAATSEEEQKTAIEKDYPMFSHPVDHDEFLGILAGEVEAADTSRGYED